MRRLYLNRYVMDINMSHFPSAKDRCFRTYVDDDGIEVIECVDTVIRDMTPDDLKTILDNAIVGLDHPIFFNGYRCKGIANMRYHLILIDPYVYCSDETLIHEAAHLFYKEIDIDEGYDGKNPPMYYKVLGMMKDKRYKSLALEKIRRLINEADI